MASSVLAHLRWKGSQLTHCVPALAQGQVCFDEHDEVMEQQQQGSVRAGVVFRLLPRPLDEDFRAVVLAMGGGEAGDDDRFDPVRWGMVWDAIALIAYGTSIEGNSSDWLCCDPQCEV